MLIEIKGVRFLTDPGLYTTAQNKLRNIDAIIITHDHHDHFHTESLNEIMQFNLHAKIYTNSTVGKILKNHNVEYTRVEDGDRTTVRDIPLEGYGKEHAQLHSTIPAIPNTGYFFDNRFYYPGDSFFNPEKNIETLALPVAGPWMKISEAVDFAIEMNPRNCFPVHDGNCKSFGGEHIIPNKILNDNKINFFVPELEKQFEI